MCGAKLVQRRTSVNLSLKNREHAQQTCRPQQTTGGADDVLVLASGHIAGCCSHTRRPLRTFTDVVQGAPAVGDGHGMIRPGTRAILSRGVLRGCTRGRTRRRGLSSCRHDAPCDIDGAILRTFKLRTFKLGCSVISQRGSVRIGGACVNATRAVANVVPRCIGGVRVTVVTPSCANLCAAGWRVGPRWIGLQLYSFTITRPAPLQRVYCLQRKTSVR